MDRLEQLFQQFVRERTYINNVTSSTCEWYDTAWKAFKAAHVNAPARPASAPLITKADLQFFVVHLRERGVKPVSCHCWVRALNAFCRWLQEQVEIPVLVKLPPQRLTIEPIDGMSLTRNDGWLRRRSRFGRLRKILMHAGNTISSILSTGRTGNPLIGIEERRVPQEPRIKTAKIQPLPIGDRFVSLCPEQLLEGIERRCLFRAFWDKSILIFPSIVARQFVGADRRQPSEHPAHLYSANIIPTAPTAKHQVWHEVTKQLVTIGESQGVYSARLHGPGTLTAMDLRE